MITWKCRWCTDWPGWPLFCNTAMPLTANGRRTASEVRRTICTTGTRPVMDSPRSLASVTLRGPARIPPTRRGSPSKSMSAALSNARSIRKPSGRTTTRSGSLPVSIPVINRVPGAGLAGKFRPASRAPECSLRGRAEGPGTALEGFGEEIGGGSEMFLFPGTDTGHQMGEADLQLVAVVAYGGVDQRGPVGL